MDRHDGQRAGDKQRAGGARRSDAARLADHAEIDRLAEDLLPALIAKLGASGLGELEVREDDWTIRLRRPADEASGGGHKVGDRAARSAGGGSGGPTVNPGSGSASGGHAASAARSLAAVGPGRAAEEPPHRAVATSPAVGVFHPRPELRAGARVRGGDRIASVDVLGIPQDVVAPVDGVLGASLVEAGEPVEYGQELVRIELLGGSGPAAPGPGTAAPGPGTAGHGSAS